MTEPQADAILEQAINDVTRGQGDAGFLVVQGRLTGIRDYVLGGDHDAFAPRGVAQVRARAERIAKESSTIARHLAKATGHGESAVLLDAGCRFLLLIRDDEETQRNLVAERARIEADFLRWFEGALGIVISGVPASRKDLASAEGLLKRLDYADRRYAATPFLDVLEQEDVLGPYPHEPADEVREHDDEAATESIMVARAGVDDLRVRILAADRPSLSHALGITRAVSEYVRRARQTSAEQGDGSLVHLFAGVDELILSGSAQDVLGFLSRLPAAFDDAAGGLQLTVSAATAFSRERTNDVARLARDATRALDRLRIDGVAGMTRTFGARVPTTSLGELIDLGDDLVQLSNAQPGLVAALLEAALRISENPEGKPLSDLVVLRGRIHELVSRFGVGSVEVANATPPMVREPAREPGFRAVCTLIREFPRMFEAGEGRVPLAYAVLRSRLDQG